LNAWGYPAGLPLGAAELLSFGQHFEVTLVDPATRLNWLSSVSASGAAEVAREAAASVAWLQVQHDKQTQTTAQRSTGNVFWLSCACISRQRERGGRLSLKAS
jgi:hypothetical protein